jgi:hypothetical protein
MANDDSDEKKVIDEVKKILGGKEEINTKRVSIVNDGKQYNIRIPVEYAIKANVNPLKDEFEFTLEIPEDKSELPKLYGELVEKE